MSLLKKEIKSLEDKINELPKDATVADHFKVISEWEKEAMVEFRKREHTSKSGYLKPMRTVI